MLMDCLLCWKITCSPFSLAPSSGSSPLPVTSDTPLVPAASSVSAATPWLSLSQRSCRAVGDSKCRAVHFDGSKALVWPAGVTTYLSSSSAGWRSRPAGAGVRCLQGWRQGWRRLLPFPSGRGSPLPAVRSACKAVDDNVKIYVPHAALLLNASHSEVTCFCVGGASWGRYLGELSHQRAVLQPEVLLLAVQLPLKHLILAQQRLHFLHREKYSRLTVSEGNSAALQPLS